MQYQRLADGLFTPAGSFDEFTRIVARFLFIYPSYLKMLTSELSQRLQNKAHLRRNVIMTTARFSHLNQDGEAKMVDITHKAITQREALAEGVIYVPETALQLLIAGECNIR